MTSGETKCGGTKTFLYFSVVVMLFGLGGCAPTFKSRTLDGSINLSISDNNNADLPTLTIDIDAAPQTIQIEVAGGGIVDCGNSEQAIPIEDDIAECEYTSNNLYSVTILDTGDGITGLIATDAYITQTSNLNQLANLTTLYLANNNLSSIPEQLPNGLQYLALQGNILSNELDLSILPSALEFFNAQNNEFSSLVTTDQLVSLTSLHLTSNLITAINVDNGTPPALQTLSLSDNLLDDFPVELLVPSIINVYLASNSLSLENLEDILATLATNEADGSIEVQAQNPSIILSSNAINLVNHITVSVVVVAYDPAPFVSIWRTTGADETITLPLRSGYNYNFTVDWGDESPISHISTWDDTDKEHEYAIADDYTVTITGQAEAWYFNNSGDKNKIIAVTDFGDMGWTTLESAFSGCSNLESFSGGVTNNVTNLALMFDRASNLTDLDLSTFNTSNVENMAEMFSNTVLSNIDLSHFNTSNVTTMNKMFYDANVTTLNLANWNTSSVTNMSGMFGFASGLTSLDLLHFDTANVENMSNMFFSASNLTNLDLSEFKTQNVTNMSQMFKLTSNLTTLNTSGWDLTLSSGSTDVLLSTNAGLVVTCDQGGDPGTGTFFGKNCN